MDPLGWLSQLPFVSGDKKKHVPPSAASAARIESSNIPVVSRLLLDLVSLYDAL